MHVAFDGHASMQFFGLVKNVFPSNVLLGQLSNTTKGMWSKPHSVQEQWKPKQHIIPQKQWTTQETILQEEVHQATKIILEK